MINRLDEKIKCIFSFPCGTEILSLEINIIRLVVTLFRIVPNIHICDHYEFIYCKVVLAGVAFLLW